jgi:DNA-directed RNA polymerase beta subunit
LVGGDRRMIETTCSKYLRMSKYSTGHLLNTMFSLNYGQDQEDSIVLSERAVQTLYLQMFEDTYSIDLQKISATSQQYFQKIDQQHQNPNYNYEKVDPEKAYATPGTIVKKNDVIVCKIEVIQKKNGKELFFDKSIVFDREEGIVKQVIYLVNGNIETILVKIGTFIRLKIGDKCCVSSGGCKATISEILPN